MMTFNPRKIFSLRGIERRTGFLVRLGISYQTARRFLNSQSQYVQIKDIEKLCIALNCTPSDLFEWQPDANTVLPENHSLHSLNTGAGTKSLRQLVKDVPSDKLALIEKLLDELKK
jgi:DNA-binding Xre family transcriptional regulator